MVSLSDPTCNLTDSDRGRAAALGGRFAAITKSDVTAKELSGETATACRRGTEMDSVTKGETG